MSKAQSATRQLADTSWLPNPSRRRRRCHSSSNNMGSGRASGPAECGGGSTFLGANSVARLDPHGSWQNCRSHAELSPQERFSVGGEGRGGGDSDSSDSSRGGSGSSRTECEQMRPAATAYRDGLCRSRGAVIVPEAVCLLAMPEYLYTPTPHRCGQRRPTADGRWLESRSCSVQPFSFVL